MEVAIVGPITGVETIAIGSAIMEVKRLRRAYGSGRWRKLKGFASVCLLDGTICKAAVHWYEAHGVGKKEMKIKRLLEE